ncbi:MAG: hypothetical protein D6790_21910 [Caldilineae bacterium]|nr:MAG: hypothetical protein D6790_21910 [Caldilineae bacterium]
MQIQEMAARKKQQLLTHTLSIDQIKACRNSDTQRLSVAALKGIIIATIHNGRATSALAQRHGLSPAQAQRAFSAATKLGLLIKIESFGPNGRKCHWIAKSRKKIPLKHSTVTTFNIPQNWKDNKTLLTWAYHAMAAHVQQQSARHYVKKNQAKGELSSKKHVVQHIIDNYTITTSKAAAAMGLTTQQARKHLQRGTRMNLNIPYPDERVAPQTFPSYLDAAIVACEHNNYVQEEKNNYFAGFGFAVPFKDHAIDGQLWRIKLVFQSRWRITLPVNNPNSFSLRRKTRPIRMAAAGHPLPENMPSFYDDVKYDFEPPTPPMTVTGIRHAATKILQIINEIEQIHLNKNAS